MFFYELHWNHLVFCIFSVTYNFFSIEFYFLDMIFVSLADNIPKFMDKIDNEIINLFNA